MTATTTQRDAFLGVLATLKKAVATAAEPDALAPQLVGRQHGVLVAMPYPRGSPIGLTRT